MFYVFLIVLGVVGVLICIAPYIPHFWFLANVDIETFAYISIFIHIFVVILYWGGFALEQPKRGRSVVSSPTRAHKRTATKQADLQIESFKQSDPNFSKVLFLDFVSALYHRFYTSLGTPQFTTLSPFFANSVLEQGRAMLKNCDITMSEIVIGSMKMKIKQLPKTDYIHVEFDANYTMTVNQENSERHVVLERWLFARDKGVLSKEPEHLRDLSCPNCGAPINFTDAGQCEYCGKIVKAGEMQWFVRTRAVVRLETFSTSTLGTYAPERGSQLPTLKQQHLDKMTTRFANAHEETWQSFWQRFTTHIVTPYFHAIYDAWTRQEWHEIRHLVSDRLYESNRFWLDAYKSRGFVNKLENIAIKKIEVVRLDLDAFYESVTVRVFASCLDYVEDASGRLIGGSKNSSRTYSEYWTFIRRTGLDIDESQVNLQTCPNCGAKADNMGEAAECGYCGSKISTGDFSWVLAVITQDEAYQG
jgi:predicted lipid-binding transport protein (Tim44 family)/ribosomal protein L24E